MENKFIYTKKGFTLLEVLVVITIITLLASIILISVKTTRGKARDARRLSDIKQIQTALQLYYEENKSYPTATGASCYDGWESSCDSDGLWMEYLSPFLSETSKDPINNGSLNYFYSYYHYSAAYAQSIGCSFNSAFSVLGIKSFEQNNSSKGVSAICSGRNWYPEFDYSIMLIE